MGLYWNDALQNKCRKMVSHMVARKPCEGEKDGLNEMKDYVIDLFIEQGFEIEQVANDDAPYRPVIIAKFMHDKKKTIGFFGHYDVEEVRSEKWTTDPWNLTEVDGRWQARGVADNLVPLAQRILLCSQMSAHANLVFVLQGEEEIGSPFAMEVYSELNLPKIDLWFEETGYFYKNGDHRVMAFNITDELRNVFSALEKLNNEHGRATKVRERPMNKAFGNQGCPCLVHLVEDIPYIALGPNDDFSKIHGVDESINPSLLGISAQQILTAVEVFCN